MLVSLALCANASEPVPAPPGFEGPRPLLQWVRYTTEHTDRRVCYEDVPVGDGPWRLVGIPASAAAASASAGYPVRFEVREVGGRSVLVPAAVDDGGGWVPVTPVLDQGVDLGSPPTGQSIDGALDRWMTQLEAATGREVILMSWSVVGHPPCPVGGAGPARELLARILDC